MSPSFALRDLRRGDVIAQLDSTYLILESSPRGSMHYVAWIKNTSPGALSFMAYPNTPFSISSKAYFVRRGDE